MLLWWVGSVAMMVAGRRCAGHVLVQPTQRQSSLMMLGRERTRRDLLQKKTQERRLSYMKPGRMAMMLGAARQVAGVEGDSVVGRVGWGGGLWGGRKSLGTATATSGLKFVSGRNGQGSESGSPGCGRRRTTTALFSSSSSSFSKKSPGSDSWKVEALRAELEKLGASAMVIPSDDPHLSEYVAPCFERRAFVSGFTGSAGTAVVTQDRAVVWTDSRYWLQAEQELGEGWELAKSGEPGVAGVAEWVAENVPSGSVVGVDGRVTSAKLASTLRTELKKRGASLACWTTNPVDAVWGAERPAIPSEKIRVHPLEFAGESVEAKLTRTRVVMREKQADALAVATLDDVCWLYNIRGADVACNPVALSYAVVTENSATLYCDSNKIDADVAQHLHEAGVDVKPYEQVLEDIRSIPGTVWIDPDRSSEAFAAAVEEDARIPAPSPLLVFKAVKNRAEIQGMQAAHIRDGAAAVRGFAKIADRIAAGDPSLDEVAVDVELTTSRARDPAFLEPSFPTIAGYGPNGAVVHYVAKPSTASSVSNREFLLVDSGGQYLDGTTDVTRTFHFGDPSPAQKEAFTRVLKGNIALDTAVFPQGTPGCALDAFARQHLWRAGLDYGHGTGHGVGAALNVHEGPQSVSPRFANTAPLRAGMIISNEPGFYLAGAFGVRIENLLLVEPVVETETRSESGLPSEKPFLRFTKLTLIPIDTNCVDPTLLDPDETKWLDDYHRRVLNLLEPLLADDPRALAWLRHKCRPLADVYAPTSVLAR